MTNFPFQSQAAINEQSDTEIDLKQVAKAVFRHKFLVAKITAVSIVISGLYAVTRSPVWEGQFEIVLASNPSSSSQASQLLQSNPGLANLIGASGDSNQLETEVQILESPSVLKPVFDFVKQNKKQKGINVKEWSADWLDKLNNQTHSRHSVLELSYKDTDKDLVLPVISKISSTYQNYSGRDRERGIKQAIEYLDEQLVFYNNKSILSLRDAQEYGIEQDLTSLQGEGADDSDTKNSLNIEQIRISAANQTATLINN